MFAATLEAEAILGWSRRAFRKPTLLLGDPGSQGQGGQRAWGEQKGGGRSEAAGATFRPQTRGKPETTLAPLAPGSWQGSEQVWPPERGAPGLTPAPAGVLTRICVPWMALGINRRPRGKCILNTEPGSGHIDTATWGARTRRLCPCVGPGQVTPTPGMTHCPSVNVGDPDTSRGS